MEIIPAVDVLNGRVVRLLRGDFDAVTEYGPDPVATSQRWVEHGAELIHVVDLRGAKTGEPDRELWKALGDADIPFQVGGGIRRLDLAEAAIAAGAQRVVFGSAAVWEPGVLHEAARVLGPDRVVVAFDVRNGRATGSGWLDEGRALDDVLERLATAGLVWAMVTAVHRDGTMSGPDVGLIEHVAAAGWSVIGSGGVGSLEHLQLLAAAGAEAAVVGRALYDGAFTLAEAQASVG